VDRDSPVGDRSAEITRAQDRWLDPGEMDEMCCPGFLYQHAHTGGEKFMLDSSHQPSCPEALHRHGDLDGMSLPV